MQSLKKIWAKFTGQKNASENNTNNSQPSHEEGTKDLVESNPIKGTPLHIIGNHEKGYFIAFGKWRLTEPLPTVEHVKQHYKENTMNLTIQIVSIIIDNLKELQKRTPDTIKKNITSAKPITQSLNRMTDILRENGHQIINP